eukprot:scaffold79588_cov53-Attheya_sp.AAC.3
MMAVSPVDGFSRTAMSMSSSSSTSTSEMAQLNRGRLLEALSSPSGKLTISPEIVIPEPTDPTAILLQASAIKTLSERIRVKAKANAALIVGSIESLRKFVEEQEVCRGNFPGPVPVIYYGSSSGNAEELECSELMQALGEIGAAGVVVPVFGGSVVNSLDDIGLDDALAAKCSEAMANGVVPLPEVVLANGLGWGEEDVENLVEKLSAACGMEPVSIILTVNTPEEEDTEEKGEDESKVDDYASLPKVPKALGRKTPILGSVRVTAGQNRMGAYIATLKDAGFTGAFLRSDCVPGFRMNPDLDVVGGFWSAAIGDLKSLKSKNFRFRSKVALATDVPMAWYNYQKDIMESGALGSAETGGESALDPDSGDYSGF